MPAAPRSKQTRTPRPPRPLSASSNTPRPVQRTNFTYDDKLRILDYLHTQEPFGITRVDVVRHFRSEFPKFAESTLHNWIEQEQNIREYVEKNPQRLAYKRPLHVKLPRVDQAVGLWTEERIRRGVRLTGDVICEKARQFSDDLGVPEAQRSSFSHGWLDRFKARTGLRDVRYHGEAASAPVEQIDTEVTRTQRILCRRPPRDTYNFDETAAYSCRAPGHGLAAGRMAGFKDDKTRMTVGNCTNGDGSDKRRLLFIGHSQKPRAFGGKTGAALGYDYDHSPKAWMNGEIWARWLYAFDADMRSQGRNVLLLVDNAAPHKQFDKTKLTSVQVEFLAPNLTAFIQPLDAGIIRCFKAHYNRGLLRKAIERDAANEKNIHQDIPPPRSRLLGEPPESPESPESPPPLGDMSTSGRGVLTSR